MIKLNNTYGVVNYHIQLLLFMDFIYNIDNQPYKAVILQ